jgi:protein ImuB
MSSLSGVPAPAETLPLVTVGKVKGAQRVVAVDVAAAARGLKPNMTLADARAVCPSVRVAEADPDADAALAARIVDWCRRFTPLSAPDGPDGVLLDIGGASHLFGGEAELIAAIERGLGGQGFSARAAVASTPEAAWALARFGAEAPLGTAPGSARIAPTPLEPGFERLVAALPLAALRIETETVAALARAGLRRIGDLLMRPRGPIAARFGTGVLARLDGVMGLAKTPTTPRFEAPRCVAERRFASGLAHSEQIEAALLPLSRHLCASLDRHGQGARRIEAFFFRVDGAVKRLAIGTSRPLREPEALMALLREKLAAIGEQGLDTGYGFDLIRLSVTEAERLDARQDDLAGPDAGDPARAMADLADRLGARLGLKRVIRLAPCGTHVPECAVVALPMASGTSRDGGREAVLGGAIARSAAMPEPDGVPCRPMRLFHRPELIDTIAAVPDGPPVRFRWRRVVHEIAAIEGPERIAPEWWNGDAERRAEGEVVPPGALTRDYFRAEDRQGRRFWLYREGLFGRETAQPRWFLHGLFG